MISFFCAQCKKEIATTADDIFIHNKRRYCKICADKYFTSCDSCCTPCRFENIISVDNNALCPDCFNENYTQCANCNENILAENALSTPSDNLYCESCFSDDCCSCISCDVVMWNNDAHYNDGDNDNGPFCTTCSNVYKIMPTTTFNICTSKRRYGIELEFCAEGCVPNLTNYGRLKDDGSVNPIEGESGCGHEFASNIYAGDAGFNMIDTICRKLQSCNPETYVNRTCGLHLHLDMTNEDEDNRKNIVMWWQALERIIFSTVPVHRRENTFCESIATRTYIDINHSRYSSLNISAYSKYKTFEVRLHQGTLNPSVIKSWILFMTSFMDTFSEIACTTDRINAVQNMSDRGKLIFLFQQTKMLLSLRKTIYRRIMGNQPMLYLSKIA